MADWNVNKRNIDFVENALKTHNCVESVTREQDIIFHIERTEDRSAVIAVLVNVYTVSLANVLKISRQYPDVNCIVTCSKWNSYTDEAKDYGRKNKIGIFDVSEFFGSLNWSAPYKYVKKDDDGRSSHTFRSA
jgi:hypothetical protein